MLKLWIRLKRWAMPNLLFCGKCGVVIPFGTSAWYDKLDQEWCCRKCAPDPW